MSVHQPSQIGFDFTQLNPSREAAAKDNGAFALQLAQFQSANLNQLISSALAGKNGKTGSGNNPLFASTASGSNPLFGDTAAGGSEDSTGLGGLSPAGRNLSLFDPESGYKMMSLINKKEIGYQAEFAALSQMTTEVAQMQHEGEDLTKLGSNSDNASIRAELQQFVDEYNQWVREFDDEMRAGGALSDSNAARMSRYELDQSIENPFNGAEAGVRGMADLGLTIDPNSKLATLDTAKLEAVLAGNKTGAVATIQSFSANFVKSAQLLNADNNFIANRLGNLERVIQYISSNKTSLQAEFGLGDAASPTAAIAQALAAYKQMAKG